MLHRVDECLGGLFINEQGNIVAPMFDLPTMMGTQTQLQQGMWELTLCVSIVCAGVSVLTTLWRPLRLRKSVDLIYWTVLIWQLTNVIILGVITTWGISRSLLAFFDMHTFLEWVVSLFYEYHLYYQQHKLANKDKGIGERRKRYSFRKYMMQAPCSTMRLAWIAVIVMYVVAHALQVYWDADLLRAAYYGRFGYFLDAVGLFSSLSFAIQQRSWLGLFCLGAFGSHALAIVGTFMACVLAYPITWMLLSASLVQNVCSTLAVIRLSIML